MKYWIYQEHSGAVETFLKVTDRMLGVDRETNSFQLLCSLVVSMQATERERRVGQDPQQGEEPYINFTA